MASLKRRALERALKKIAGSRFTLPPKLRFVLSEAAGVRCVAFMVEGRPVVFLGPKIATPNPSTAHPPGLKGGVGQKGPRGVAHHTYDSTWRGLNNPKQTAQATATVIHELGHVLHELQNPERFWEFHDKPIPPDVAKVAIQVSHYATNSPLEFVAEVFTGGVLGKRYGKEVRDAYGSLGGPTPAGGRFLQ